MKKYEDEVTMKEVFDDFDVTEDPVVKEKWVDNAKNSIRKTVGQAEDWAEDHAEGLIVGLYCVFLGAMGIMGVKSMKLAIQQQKLEYEITKKALKML